MKFTPFILLALWLATVCPAATLTVSNASANGEGFHGIATPTGTLLSPGLARAALGRMTLDDDAIAHVVATGDLNALDAAFLPFGSDFALELTEAGPAGTFEASVSADSRTSSGFAGQPVYLWIHLGADRSSAWQYLLAKLDALFPTDAEAAPPAFASLALRPETIAQLHAGSLSGSHDYDLGGGAMATLRLQTHDGNTPPIAQNLTLQVLAGVAFTSQVTAFDADLDPLEFIQVSDPAKGSLVFQSDGSFVYTADAGQSGTDSFQFKANDGKTDSDVATVTFQIQNGGLLAQTLSFTTPAQIRSDAGNLLLSATASSDLPVNFTLLSGPANLDGATLTLTGATGTLLVRASQPGNASYAAVHADRLIHVVPAADAFALGSLSQVYLGIPLHVSILGAPPDEVTLTYNGSPNPPTNAGTYSVVAVHGQTRKIASLVIAKATLTVTADDHHRLIGQPNPSLNLQFTGFVGGDSLATVFPSPATPHATPPVASTTAKTTSPAGQYPIRLRGGTAANYRFIHVPGTLTVEGFDGRHEILLTDPADSQVTAKVELTVSRVLKNGLLPFTGKLWAPTETVALPLKGGLSLDPATERATEALTFTHRQTTYALTLELDLEGNLSAELHIDGNLHSRALNGRKLHVFSKTNPPPSLGSHTLILAPGQPVAAGEHDLPAGAGHATGLILANGQLKLAGRLADGTALTTSLRPDAEGCYRLYANPYKRRNSWVAGHLHLTPHPDLNGRGHIAASAGQSLIWTKEGSNKDKSYRAGIDRLQCALRLDPWRKPAKANRNSPAIILLDELGLSEATTLGVAYSDLPALADAGLPFSVQLAANGKFHVLEPIDTPTGWQLTLNTGNGSFKGRFILRDGKTRTVNVSGVLSRQLSTDPSAVVGRGYFLLPAVPGAATTEMLSGEIQFTLD